MTTLDYLFRHIITTTFALLPDEMRSPHAAAMLLAITLQEADAKWRVQFNGPALGLWQFEAGGGVKGVCLHPLTQPHLKRVLPTLCYQFDVSTPQKTRQTYKALHAAMEHNDVLACVFARLNLWWLPRDLPSSDDHGEGWQQYLDTWNPGKPHPETWRGNFTRAWDVVNAA